MNTDSIELSFWTRENSIDKLRDQVNQLNTHFSDLFGKTFAINAVVFGPDNNPEGVEWQLNGTGSANPADEDYTLEARIMAAAITAAKREMQAICAEMLLLNREILKQS